MSKSGFIIRYVTQGDFLTGTDRWDFYALAEANATIEGLKAGKCVRVFGEGLSEGDLIGLFSTPRCEPADEIKTYHIASLRFDPVPKNDIKEQLEKIFEGEKELRVLEYLNGEWIEYREGNVKTV